MFDEVCSRGFNAARGSFTQSYGGPELDASLLRLPLVGFLPADDPRVRGTVAAIERELLEDGLVLRYRPDAGLEGMPPTREGASMCKSGSTEEYPYGLVPGIRASSDAMAGEKARR